MTVRPAATVILLRETNKPDPFEVLLLRRSKELAFAGGFWVFPGGAIDPEDFNGDGSVGDCSDTQLLAAVHQAAARETMEESGIDVGEQNFAFYSHWTTPESQPKRFSTWFMMGVAPVEHEVVVDNSEITQYQWLSPAEAIAKQAQGRLLVAPPAYISLLELSVCDDIDSALGFARKRAVPYFLPKLHKQDERILIIYDGDVAHDGGDFDADGPRHRMEIQGKTYNYMNTLGRE